MEVNTWVDFLLYTSFTLGIILVGLPMGISYTFVSIRFLIKQDNTPYHKLVDTEFYGKSPYETLFVGLFMLSASIWYLFIDLGGHLILCFNNVSTYFAGN